MTMSMLAPELVPDDDGHPAARRDLVGTAWALSWRAAGTLTAGAALAVLLGGAALTLAGGSLAPRHASSASGALALVLATFTVLLVAAVAGMTVAVSGIALLVRNHLDQRGTGEPVAGRRRHLQLPGNLRTALASTPKVLLLGAAATVTVAVLAAATPLLMLVALARTGWQLARRRVPARRALRCLRWAVPFAAAAAAAAAAPAVYASLINGAPLRAALRSASTQRLRAQAAVLAGLLVLTAVNVGLTRLTLHGLHGGASYFAAVAASLLLAGLALGVLAHIPARAGGTDRPDTSSGVAARVERRSRSLVRRLPRARARVAVVTTFALFATSVTLAGPALATPSQAPNAIIVNDATDPSTTVDTSQCQNTGPCGIRAALALAGQQVASTGSATVTFDDSLDGATISLAGTLMVAGGVTVDTGTNTVTLDAHHGFRAVETYEAGGEGPRVTLRGVHVIGGRSSFGGAGLYSNGVSVVLDQTTWADNVSGGDGGGDGSLLDGGAVAVPYSALTVTNSTFSANQATAGVGGAMAALELTLTNSTLADNTGVTDQPDGGAVYASGGGHVSQVTVSGSGGLAGSAGRELQVTNTLVTEPVGPWFACIYITGADDPDAPSVGNVDSSGSCFGTAVDPSQLGALSDNGGRTATMIPAPSNPAIGAGSADWCEPTDQRGEPRDASSCDAGAVQANGDVPTVTLHLQTSVTYLAGEDDSFTADVHQDVDNTIPVGTLQMVEGATLLGAPVQIDPNNTANTLSVPALAQGPHTVAVRFTPPGGGRSQDSSPATINVVVPTQVILATSAPVTINSAATLVATITDDTSSGPGRDPGAPAPSGTATFIYNDTQSTDVPVVDGVASLDVDSLTSAFVEVRYSGDGWYAFSFVDDSDVLAADLATTTSVSVVTPSVENGAPTQVAVHVTDARGASPTGFAHFVVDGSDVGSEGVDAGRVTLAADLAIGSHTGYVTFDPATGWAASRSSTFSFTVIPSHSGITLDYDAAHPAAYPDQPYLTFTATGAGGTATTAVLKDENTVIATQTVVLPESWHFTIPDGTFDVGTRTLHAELLPTATVAGSSSPDVPVTITPGVPGLTVTPQAGAQVGLPETVQVVVAGTLPATLTVATGDGTVVTTARLVSSGNTSFSYTPTALSTDLTVTATFDDGRYATAVHPFTLAAAPADVPGPTLLWQAGTDFDTAPPYLLVTYPAGAGLSDVTGLVTVYDARNNWIGSATVSRGSASVAVHGLPGTCYCGPNALHADFTDDDPLYGDGLYAERTDLLPDLTTPGRATSTGLVVHTLNLRPGQPVAMTVNVSTPNSSTTPTGSVTVALNGQDFAFGTLSGGHADVTGWIPQTLTGPITLTARYSPDVSEWNTSQTSVGANVIDYVPPIVTLSVGGFDYQVGHAYQMGVSARVVDPSAPLDLDTPFSVYDDTGALLGTGSWLSNGSAMVTFTPAHGGTRLITVHFSYAGGKSGTSQPLVLGVAGTPLPLTATASGPAGVEQWVFVHVTAAVPAGITPGAMTVSLYNNGQPVGSPQPLAPGAGGTLSANLSFLPQAKGPLTLVAHTDGDGGDVGGGNGAVSMTVAAGQMQLRTGTSVTRVTYGKPFTTPAVSFNGTLADKTDGMLETDILDAAGAQQGGCVTVVPASQCQVQSLNLTPGTYTLSYRYFGSSVYDDLPAVVGPQVVIGRSATSISPSFSVDPSQWVAGIRVSATFAVSDSFNDDGSATGSIRLSTPTYGTLCTVGVTNAATATCTFTVPWPALPLAQQLKRTSEWMTAAFTPSGYSTPSTGGAYLGGIAGCFAATADRSSAVTFDSGVPTIAVADGQVCQTASASDERAGTLAGYTEGSSLTVTDNLAKVGAGWTYDGVTVTQVGADPHLELPVQPGSGDAVVWDLTANVRLAPSFTWAPTCVEIATGWEMPGGYGLPLATYPPNALADGRLPAHPRNSVNLLTPSNCASPFQTMSPAEKADFANGVGHYVVGTDVSVWPSTDSPYSPTLARPAWTLRSIPGTAKGADGYYHLTAAAASPAVVYGVFRWSNAMCQTVATAAGGGGTVAITASAFPDTLSPFEKPDGTCTTSSGAPGYLAGTTVTATATPTNSLTASHQPPAIGATYLYRWPDASSEDLLNDQSPTATSEVPGSSGQIAGDPYAAHSTSLVVSPTGGTSFTATFARVECVPVTVSLSGLTMSQLTMSAGNCAAIPTDQDAGGATVRYYTAHTHVTFSAPATKPGGYGITLGLHWQATLAGAGGQQTLTFDGQPAGAFDVPDDPAGVQLSDSYVNTACRRAPVGTWALTGYSYTAYDGNCPIGQSTGSNTTWVEATMPAAAKANGVVAQWHVLLTPHSAVVAGLDGTTSSTADPVITHGNEIGFTGWPSVDLTFCRPLTHQVAVSLVDYAGHTLSGVSAPSPASVFEAYNSSCVGLSAEVSFPAQLELSTAGAQKWLVVGWRNNRTGVVSLTSTSPSFSVGLNGEVTDSWTALLTPHCYQLTTGDRVSVQTPANCVGADPTAGMYAPGTAVSVSFDSAVNFGEYGWIGTDSANGDSAIAIMNGDRNVYMHYDVQQMTGMDTFLVGASNAGQRTVAGVEWAANTIMLEPVAVVFSAGPAVLGGIADGLEGLGIHGAGVDGIRNFGDTLAATGTALTSWGTCMTDWATGGGGTSGALTPSSTAGTDTLAGANASASVGAYVADKQDADQLGENSSALKGLNAVRAGLNLFTANLSAYSSDPQQAWSSMSDQVMACVENDGQGMVDSGNSLG
jgi:hypothetical protein